MPKQDLWVREMLADLVDDQLGAIHLTCGMPAVIRLEDTLSVSTAGSRCGRTTCQVVYQKGTVR